MAHTVPPAKACFEHARIYTRDQHPVSRQLISKNALKVMKQLRLAGYSAFLVGGAVRDMMLGQAPKDFDVATDATPEQIRKVFRNARIIGRRFRIIHVHFGPEIIEVTTFRGHHDANADTTDNHHSASDEQGMLLRDNVFGTIEEDALRRDFTINALYYSSEDFCIYDFTSGIEDIHQRTLRLIGDPGQRYKEDPVRMLRAIRFAGKLGFSLEQHSNNAIDEHAALLRNIPPARLFDETLKLFCGGYGANSLDQLLKHRLLGYLVADSALISDNPFALALLRTALANSDARLAEGKSITPTFILSALLWPHLQQARNGLKTPQLPPLAELFQAGDIVMQQQARYTGIPKRIQIGIREIWELQIRLQQRHGPRAIKLLQHPRFRAAYDFLLLREQCGEELDGLGQWWTELQQQPEEQQLETIRLQASEAGSAVKKPRKRRPRTRKPAGP